MSHCLVNRKWFHNFKKLQQITALKNKFKQYFLKLSDKELDLVKILLKSLFKKVSDYYQC